MSNTNGKTLYTVSVYETDEQIQIALCDDCAGNLPPYQWLRFADAGDCCVICETPNAVDVVAMPHLWSLTPEDCRNWDEYTERLKGGAL